MSFIIGLTGPTGSGKSSVASVAQKLGYKVIDCDKLARVAVDIGSDGLEELTKAFGDEILNSDGSLNRKALAQKAFSTKEKTQLLNNVLLPHIAKLVTEQIDTPLVLLDAPTLFESGLNSKCNITIAVLADEKIRFSRITERDGLTINEANTRINAGKSDEFYKKNADYILYNNKDFDSFNAEISSLLETIRR